MLGQIKHYLRRARELSAQGDLANAVFARISSRRATAKFSAQQAKGKVFKEYSALLPEGSGAQKITLRLSVPFLRGVSKFAFADHVVDEQGRMTQTLLALGTGGFAISRDLGKTWKTVKIKGHSGHSFFQIGDIGGGEFLVQGFPAQDRASKVIPLDLLVVSEDGAVLAKHPRHSHRWHGCRSMGRSGETLMFAEYLSNIAVNGRRPVDCRVWRSRDRGRTWQVVFQQSGANVRHFHFLQPRPGVAGEWWLTSGDLPNECHIWVSKDAGESWNEVSVPKDQYVEASGELYKRDLFRLTDLVWLGDEVVWGTDDYMGSGVPPGARVFKSRIGGRLKPELVGIGKWHFRSAVDIGDHLLFISQKSNVAHTSRADARPGVYLMPKNRASGAPGLFHVCDLDTYPSRDRPGFTFSKASRAAVNGTFFSYRSSEDVFPAGHRILEWNVTLE